MSVCFFLQANHGTVSLIVYLSGGELLQNKMIFWWGESGYAEVLIVQKLVIGLLITLPFFIINIIKTNDFFFEQIK